MFVLTARVSVDPARVAEFEVLARALWAATHRGEPRCRRYEYVRLTERGHYLTFMAFDDYDAFLAHQASDHHIHIAGGAMRELIRSVEIDFATPVDGAFGDAGHPEPIPVEIDAATLRYYRERYPEPDFGDWD